VHKTCKKWDLMDNPHKENLIHRDTKTAKTMTMSGSINSGQIAQASRHQVTCTDYKEDQGGELRRTT